MLEWLGGVKLWFDRVIQWTGWFDALNTWWANLDFTLQVYWFIALLASTILFLQTLLILFGMGVDELDIDADVDAAAGIGVLSFRSVNAFFVGFGWSGVIALQAGWGLPSTVGVSVLAGAVMMSMVYWLMRFFYGMQASGNVDYKSAVGVTGTVYLPIPANRQGTGQIEIVLGGQLRVATAYNISDREIGRNNRVRVVEQIDGNILLVEPFEPGKPGT